MDTHFYPGRSTGGFRRFVTRATVAALAAAGLFALAPTAPVQADATQCAPDYTWSLPLGATPEFTVETFCDQILADQQLKMLTSELVTNDTDSNRTFKQSYKEARSVSVEGGMNTEYLSAKLGGTAGEELTREVDVTVKPQSEITVKVFVVGTVIHGHQYQFPTGDKYCNSHPAWQCARENFTVSREEYLSFTASGFVPSLQLQFGMSGPCVTDCDDPHYEYLPGYTVNANLVAKTFDARNLWNQRVTGTLMVTRLGRNVRKAVLVDTDLAGSWFTVTYNDVGTPITVEFQFMQYEQGNNGSHTRATAVLTTTQATGF